jgi:hypothetical protein
MACTVERVKRGQLMNVGDSTDIFFPDLVDSWLFDDATALLLPKPE